MGLTVTKSAGIDNQPQRLGQFLVAVVDIQFDASYPTGGETLTASMIPGMNKILAVLPFVDASGRAFYFDPTASKLKAFQDAGAAAAFAEVPNATNLGLTIPKVVVLGF